MRSACAAFCAAIAVFALCAGPVHAGVIPLPRSMQALPGTYAPGQTVTIAARSADERNVASFLVDFLGAHGVRANISSDAHAAQIRLSSGTGDAQIGPEGYRLFVGADGIAIQANGGAGLFYGLQTLEMLAPSDGGPLRFASVRVDDLPQYAWRGIHLDVSRHFFGVPTVERYIDLAARYKLNTFHWHLTDDQGWRIEIKKYPRLTSIGGCRAGSQVGGEGETKTDGKRYCGFYTQAQIREVVAYAAKRYITVVPEIEGPGHSVAAVAAYPWLGCDGKQYSVRELWGVSQQIMCPTERTFGFIDDVMGEVASLFPGPYVHIGGDEVPTDAWQASAYVSALRRREHLTSYAAVQGYFTRRVEQIAEEHHKRIVGWDEILDGGVSQRAVVMAWQGVARGALAVKRGNDVVMNPDGIVYFDASQGNKDFEPLSIGGLLTLQMVYDYDPMPPGLTPDQARHILGAQADVWAEYIPTTDHLFYMLLPRELALAELCWTPRSEMHWDDFQSRMGSELTRLESEGLHYRIPDVTFSVAPGGSIAFPEQPLAQNETDIEIADAAATVALRESAPGAVIHYTLDGSQPSQTSAVYASPLPIAAPDAVVRAVAVLPDGRMGSPSTLRVTMTASPAPSPSP